MIFSDTFSECSVEATFRKGVDSGDFECVSLPSQLVDSEFTVPQVCMFTGASRGECVTLVAAPQCRIHRQEADECTDKRPPRYHRQSSQRGGPR